MAINQLGDGSLDGVQVGVSGGKVGMYGMTPVVARPNTVSLHATSYVSISASFGNGTSLLSNWITEVTNTLVALGIWQT